MCKCAGDKRGWRVCVRVCLCVCVHAHPLQHLQRLAEPGRRVGPLPLAVADETHLSLQSLLRVPAVLTSEIRGFHIGDAR